MEVEDRIIQRVLGATRIDTVTATVCTVPPGDDGAVLQDDTVITLDMLVEGIHWDDRLSAADVGFKAVAVNVSDVAAMGARPTWMTLGLSVPHDDAWLEDFAQGLGEAARRWGVVLIGGDTVRTDGPRTVAVQMAGQLSGAPLTRDGARPGDTILVTGVPGLAGAGYLHASPHDDALDALRRPQPNPDFAVAIATFATSGMDLSDGLRRDLPRLCAASGVGAVIDPTCLPDHAALHEDGTDARTLQLAAGDDYELLLTVPPSATDRALSLAHAHGLTLTAVGTITADRTVRLTAGEWPAPPWQPFDQVHA